MNASTWRTWFAQYMVPTVLLIGSLAAMLVIWDDPDIFWLFVVAPSLAFLSAFVLLPRRSWVSPLAVALLITSAIVIAALMDVVEPRSPLLLLYGWGLLLVALPLTFATWLGTSCRVAIAQRRAMHSRTTRAPRSL
jgi:hypothetical protein